ncbi:MAG: helix-turn-helix transcriptional regulator [Proteobacteria bacterium]|nr:helix-turn-helix transcriptional regulator [Pseudomonadota bacterium]
MKEFDTYGGRLRWALSRAKMNQSQLAHQLNIKPQTIQYLCNPQKNAQGSIHNARMAKILNVSAIWLEANEGSPDIESNSELIEDLKQTKEALERTIDTVKSWGIDDIQNVDVELSQIIESATKVDKDNRPHVHKIVETFIAKPGKGKTVS